MGRRNAGGFGTAAGVGGLLGAAPAERVIENEGRTSYPSPMTTRALEHLLPPDRLRSGRAPLALAGGPGLARARVHEFCGPSRRLLALVAARGTEGTVIWIRPSWTPERLHPEGVQPIIEPGRLVFVTPRRPEDLLWCAEEALRSGAAPLVVAELPEPPALTPVRRLHLAAETGAAEGQVAPVGLLLTPGDGGAQGAETRWHIAPRHSAETTGWQLSLRRSRDMAPGLWVLSGPAGRDGFTLARSGPEEGMERPSLSVTDAEALQSVAPIAAARP
jgi:protein ImuA